MQLSCAHTVPHRVARCPPDPDPDSRRSQGRLPRVAVDTCAAWCDAASMTWSWHYLKTDGSAADPGAELTAAGEGFPSQSDAETWVGEHWQALVSAGVEAVVLYEEERLVYGPMSLHEEK